MSSLHNLARDIIILTFWYPPPHPPLPPKNTPALQAFPSQTSHNNDNNKQQWLPDCKFYSCWSSDERLSQNPPQTRIEESEAFPWWWTGRWDSWWLCNNPVTKIKVNKNPQHQQKSLVGGHPTNERFQTRQKCPVWLSPYFRSLLG